MKRDRARAVRGFQRRWRAVNGDIAANSDIESRTAENFADAPDGQCQDRVLQIWIPLIYNLIAEQDGSVDLHDLESRV
jgi:hypothetical protein